MDLGLKGKVAVITGASKGIGAAIAIALAREGAEVLAVARGQANFQAQAASDLVGKIHGFQADLTEKGAPEAVVAEMRRVFGRIDILCNNAGSTKPGDFLKMDDESWLAGFDLKFHAARRMARECWPMLREAKGSIVNTIGIMSRNAYIEYAMGGAVNTSLYHLTKALSELGVRDGVRVNAVNPGRIATDRLEQTLAKIMQSENVERSEAERILLKSCGIARFGTTDEVASAVCFLASERAGFINGAVLDVDGGQTRSL